MKIQWLLLLMACICLPTLAGTVTYQGQLESGDQLFDGTIEMVFELYEVDTGGVAKSRPTDRSLSKSEMGYSRKT